MPNPNWKVAIVGGGAAGFFAAIHVKENFPTAEVVIYEKSTKILSKVKVSGGGRCNVTNGCTSIKELSMAYPRGERQLKKAFAVFNTKHTMNWFESRGVPLVIQEDNCVFPVSQNSQSIIDCFLKETTRLKIDIQLETGVKELVPLASGQLKLVFSETENRVVDKVIVTTGGSPKLTGLDWLAKLGHQIETPVPSLFTFNMPNEKVRELMGIVVEKTITRIQGTKLRSDGPLLITHWGMSGPSILKLSAFGARILNEMDYDCTLQVNWTNIQNVDLVEADLNQIIAENGQKQLTSFRPYLLPDRLWRFLLDKYEFSENKRWNELGKKGVNKLINLLTNDLYQVKGKTTFKEEFVTCGGVSLASIDFNTMQSIPVKNLYFAGELIDVDGITGGYNFQAAWTTAFIAAKLA
jgi:predicted Rossmann fold flavoprotein